MELSNIVGSITALTVQQRDQDRVSVFIDGQFAFGLNAAVAQHISVGQVLTTEQAEELKQLDAVESAKKAAIRLLGRRPRSVAEVKRSLQRKNYDELVVDRVVEKLTSLDLLDDEAFGHYWVEQRETFKPRGRFALRQELRQKGIADATIEKVLSGLDEEASARRAAEKLSHRWEHLPREFFRRKLGGYLRRRGFDYEVIKLITNEMWRTIAESTTSDDATLKET